MSRTIEEVKQELTELAAQIYAEPILSTVVSTFASINDIAALEGALVGLKMQAGQINSSQAGDMVAEINKQSAAPASAASVAEQTPVAEQAPIESFAYTEQNDGTLLITGYKGEYKKIVIPNEIGGKPVVSIKSNSFCDKDITEVEIPDSVTNIGEDAFCFTQLTSVKIGDGVKIIREGAFRSSKLQNIDFGESVEIIEKRAFRNVKLKGTITLPDSVKKIVTEAFLDNPELKEVIVPDGLLVPENTFDNGVKITTASGKTFTPGVYATACTHCKKEFGKDIKQIWFCYTCGTRTDLPEPGEREYNRSAFTSQQKRAPEIAKEYADKLVYEEGVWVFKVRENDVLLAGYKGSAKDIYIPSEFMGLPVTTIAERVFYGKGLTSVNISANVTSIGDYAFYGNPITAITIPANVVSVGKQAFRQNNLESIIIEDGVKSIGEEAFENHSPKDQHITSKVANLIIPPSLRHIGVKAFKGVRLAGVTISKGVETIGEGAFFCNQLTNVVIPEGVTKIEKDAFQMNLITSLSLPESLTTIGNGAFGINEIMSLTLPSNLKKIGSDAFIKNKLTELTLPPNLKTIGSFAFSKNKLKEVAIPASYNTIGVGWFYDNELVNVTIPEGITLIGKDAFSKNALQRITFPSSLTSIVETAFAENNICGDITIPETIKRIGKEAFKKNKLTGVEIRGNTAIGYGAFARNNISKIIIGSQVPSIEGYAFMYNVGLVGVTVPESIMISEDKNEFQFSPSVYVVRGSTDHLRFDDAEYWRIHDQTITADRLAKLPKNPITFHDASGNRIGRAIFSQANSGPSFRGFKGESEIMDVNDKTVGKMKHMSYFQYINNNENFALLGSAILDSFVTPDGRVIRPWRKVVYEENGAIVPRREKEAEENRIGNVKAEGDLGAAYNREGVKVGFVKNGGEFAAQYAAAILCFLLK